MCRRDSSTTLPLTLFQGQINWLVSLELIVNSGRDKKAKKTTTWSCPLLSTEADWMIGILVEFQLILCSFLLVSIVPINFFFFSFPLGEFSHWKVQLQGQLSHSTWIAVCTVLFLCVNWSTFYTTGIKVSEIKVGPQPLELISTHNGRQMCARLHECHNS